MPIPSFHSGIASVPPGNLCELFLRDVTALLDTSKLVSRALLAARPECEFSSELVRTLDAVVATSNAGEAHLHQPLLDAGAVLPAEAQEHLRTLVTAFLTRLPATTTPAVLAAEMAVNLRLLAQHLELKAHLAAEAALLVGQRCLGQALVAWGAEWRTCGYALRAASVRARASVHTAGLPDLPAPQGA